MHNVKMIVSYDGTHYLGWQKTPFGPSIEEAIEKALKTLLKHEVSLQACSRTDAGVHAQGQVINFFTPSLRSIDILHKQLNAILPRDISIRSIENTHEAFHPTLDCIKKEYEYSVCIGPVQLPFYRKFSWHYPHMLDIDAMKKGALALIGTHDFSAFANKSKNHSQKKPIRSILDISIKLLNENQIKISIIGNHFLYKMARNIAGTLVYVGSGKIRPEQMSYILQSQDRRCCGMTAPAHGLTLKKVYYD